MAYGPPQSAYTSQTPVTDLVFGNYYGSDIVIAVPGRITGLRYLSPSTAAGNRTLRLWSSAGAALGNLTILGVNGTWVSGSFGTPIDVPTAPTTVRVSIELPSLRGVRRPEAAVTNGDLSIAATGANWSGDGAAYGTRPNSPTTLQFFTDLVFEAGAADPPPVASFTASTTTIDAGQTVTFTDTSTNTPTTWAWNFGTGASPATASTQGPHTVTFATVGTSTVNLTAGNATGSDAADPTSITVDTPPVVVDPAPYGVDVADLVTGTHTQDVILTLDHPDLEEPLTLDLAAGTLSMDATRIPRVTLDVTVRVPYKQTDLDLFDPRSGARLKLSAGYLFGSGRYDVAPVADLLCTYRMSDRPADTLALRGAGAEQRIIERGTDEELSGGAGGDAADEIKALILNREPTASVVIVDGGPPVAAAWAIPPGASPWQTVEALADAAGLEAYDAWLGTIYIANQPRLSTTPDAVLTVGDRGTVENSRSDINRDQFANAVALVHRWQTTSGGGVDTTVTGRAFVGSGPHMWGGPAGTCLFVDARTTPTTQAAADAAAEQVLYRRLGAGRGVSVDAIAAWWLRPGDTVDVQLPLGAPMRQLVTTINFDLTAGRMTVTTREPDDVTVTTTPPGG